MIGAINGQCTLGLDLNGIVDILMASTERPLRMLLVVRPLPEGQGPAKRMRPDGSDPDSKENKLRLTVKQEFHTEPHVFGGADIPPEVVEVHSNRPMLGAPGQGCIGGVQLVGTEGSGAVAMHAREHCTTHVFTPHAAGAPRNQQGQIVGNVEPEDTGGAALGMNANYCPSCHCVACGKPSSQCTSWVRGAVGVITALSTHCNASQTSDVWKKQRLLEANRFLIALGGLGAPAIGTLAQAGLTAEGILNPNAASSAPSQTVAINTHDAAATMRDWARTSERVRNKVGDAFGTYQHGESAVEEKVASLFRTRRGVVPAESKKKKAKKGGKEEKPEKLVHSFDSVPDAVEECLEIARRAMGHGAWKDAAVHVAATLGAVAMNSWQPNSSVSGAAAPLAAT